MKCKANIIYNNNTTMNTMGNGTSSNNKFVATVTLTWRRIMLNFKSFGTNVITLVLLFVIPTLFCLSSIIIAPVRYDFGMIIVSSIVLMELITYGTVAGAFRRSTLNKNSNLTIGVRWIDNLATIGTMFLMGLIMVTYVIGLLSTFDWMGILLIGINQRSNVFENSFLTSISLSIVYYYSIIVTLITYSVSYFFQGFFDSDMMFFTLGILIFVLLLLFGANFNNYFRVREHNPLIGDSYCYIKYDDTAPFGDSFFVPSLMFPFYAPTQIIKLNGDMLVYPECSKTILWTFLDSSDKEMFKGDIWKWNILWFVPYFHIGFWWTIGFTYKYFK